MLAITGGKGGCGKTTTTLGLGMALADQGHSTLVVDTDRAMPDLHTVADVPPEPGLGAVAAGRTPAEAARSVPGVPGLWALPGTDADPDRLPGTLERLTRWDGPVLLDCPAGAGSDVAGPLAAADRTLLVSAPTTPSLRDAAKTGILAAELDTRPTGLLVVETRRTADFHPKFRSRVEDSSLFSCPFLGVVPHVENEILWNRRVRTVYETAGKKVQERNI